MKNRKLKTFEDKFKISEYSKKDENFYSAIVIDNFKNYEDRKLKDNEKLKQILIDNNIYEGNFYVKEKDFNRMLSWNVEGGTENDIKLNKDENDYIKVFVVKFYGEKALLAFTTSDSWYKCVIGLSSVNHLYLEDNKAKYIKDL